MGTGTALALLAGTVLLAGCNRAQETPAESGPETALVERRTLDIRVEAAGQIEPIRIVEVKSKASGEILRLHVETGDEVQAGTLMAEIDPRDVKNALEQAQADLEEAAARLKTAIAQRTRSEDLRAANVVTQQEYEAATLEEANARAAQVKAATNIQLAQERMNDVTIRAPLAGTIISRPVEVGVVIQSASANISGGTPLMTMADLTEMQVRTLVDETDLGRVTPGLSAQVMVEAYPNRPFRGTVLKIEPQAVVDQNVTMFPVLVRLDNREKLLKPGMNADVQIEVARRDDVVAVPNAAVVGVRDAVAAGAVLGIDEETMQTALRSGMSGLANGPENGAVEGEAAPAQGDTPTVAISAECTALRQKLQQGGFAALSDEDRTKLRACRAQGGGEFGGRTGRGAGIAASGTGETRPGVVFVKAASGFEPRSVLMGVNDWEYTEVMRGLEAGDSVVLISVAQLQRAQEEFNQRMRERMGGFPGAGGSPAPGGGRR
jgi:HlyD family secretion protein